MKRNRPRAHHANPAEIREILAGLRLLPAPSEPFDLRKNAEIAEEARRLFNASWEIYRRFPHNTNAVHAFEAARERYKEAIIAAYPPGFNDAVNHLRAGDPSGMEAILAFLEVDLFSHRTGYLKEKLARWIKPNLLTPLDAVRLRRVILSIVDRRNHRDFGAFCRLARKVDAPELRYELQTRLANEDIHVRQRARWMLNFLETNNTRKE